MYDPIKYYEEEEDEPALTYVKEYKHNTLKQLVEFRHNTLTRDDIPKDEKKLRLRIIRQLIAKKLELVDLDRFQYALDEVIGEIEVMSKTFKELEKSFKSHRHATDKLYSEKPSW